MKQKINLKFLIILLIFLVVVKNEFFFNKNVWVYWDKSIQQAPILVQLCYQKIKQTCQKQGWNLTLLSDQNIKNYIKDYEHYSIVKRNAKSPFKQAIADLNRFTILYQHGGIWLDITSIMIKGFKWIQQLNQNKHLITNLNQKNLNSPDLIAFYISLFQSRTQIKNQFNGIKIFNPGYQMWFISARKKSNAIYEWKKNFQYFYQNTFEQNHQKFKNQDIYFRHLEQDDYLIGNKANYYFIQKQQFQLDKNLTLFSQRQNANQYYNIWGLKGQYGPLSYALRTIVNPYTMMTLTIRQVQQQYFDIKFFIKITQGLKPLIEKQLNNIISITQSGLTFETYLQSIPSQEDCYNVNFIVQGSIIGYLIQDNTIAQQLKLFTINKNQRQRWQQYCKKKIRMFSLVKLNQILDYIISYATNIFLGSLSNRQKVQIFEKDSKIWDKIMLQLQSKKLSFILFGLVFIGIIFMLTFLSILTKLLLILKGQKMSKFDRKNVTFFKDQDLNKIKQNSIFSQMILLLIILIFTSLNIDAFGGQINELFIILLILWNYRIRIIYRRVCQFQTILRFYLTQKQFLLIYEPISNYFIGKLILNNILVRQNKLITYGIIINLAMPFIFKIFKKLRISLQKNGQKITAFLTHLNVISNGILLISLFFIPNIKYIVFQDHYLIRSLIYLPLIEIFVLYLLTLKELIDMTLKIKNNHVNCEKNKTLQTLVQSGFQLTVISLLIYNSFFLSENFIAYLAMQKSILFELIIVFLCIGLNLAFNQTNNNSKNQFLKNKNLIFTKKLLKKIKYYLIPIIYLIFMMKHKKYQILTDALFQIFLLFINMAYCLSQIKLQNQQINKMQMNINFNENKKQYEMLAKQQIQNQVKSYQNFNNNLASI